jgi:DNA recombination protein RmuC
MIETIFLVLGIALGGIIAWFIASSRLQKAYTNKIVELDGKAKSAEAVGEERGRLIQQKESDLNQLRREMDSERQSKVEALTRLDESQKNLEEQKTLLNAMKIEMTDTFNALSKAALESSNENFLTLASERLGKIVEETKGKLGEHKISMDEMIKPLSDALKRYEEQIHAIESKRRQDYGGIEEQIKMLASTHQQLQRETSSLVTALRKPQVSGSWGQLSLKRAAELAGMTSYCDFYEQVSATTETGRLRPDMIVRLPNGREIVVDAKAPVDAYLNAISLQSEEERKKALTGYVSQVRKHMTDLGSKSYWDQFPKSPEMVVMYLPGESFFSAALEHDHKLIEDGSLKKVILATPTTFIALLKAIAYGWQQEQITKSAQEVSKLGKELYERINTMARHFEDIGSAIEKAISAYNKAVGSMETRVLPSIRKFKELGVTGAEEIPVLEQIDQTPRNLSLLSDETHMPTSRHKGQ